MTLALAAPPLARMDSDWRVPLVALAALAAALLLLFRTDATALARIYWTSTTFGHCLFIGPVIAWLVWTRRGEVAQLNPVAWAPGLLLVAAGGFTWLVGDAAGVAFARHLGLVVMLQGAVVTLLGPNVARALAFPVAYALFLVPFGESLETPLQSVTVRTVMPLLHLAGVPARVEGVLITIPQGYFEVAEACSGAKFVLAMLAYGALVANSCFRSWRRRAAFMLVSLVVPVLANGARAFATIYAAHLTSVARATGYDHIVYGWIFFGLVIAGCMALGWRWFDRSPDDPVIDPARLQGRVRGALRQPVAAALVLGVTLAFAEWGSALAARAQPLPAHIDLPEVAGWHRAPLSIRARWMPTYPGADHALFGRYVDARGDAVDLAVAVYGTQREGKELVGFGVGVLREDDRWVRVESLPPIAGGAAMRITAPGPVERVVATWYRVADVTTGDARRVKIETLKAKLLGGPQRAVAVHLSAEMTPGHDPRAAIARLAAALGPMDALADREAGMR